MIDVMAEFIIYQSLFYNLTRIRINKLEGFKISVKLKIILHKNVII